MSIDVNLIGDTRDFVLSYYPRWNDEVKKDHRFNGNDDFCFCMQELLEHYERLNSTYLLFDEVGDIFDEDAKNKHEQKIKDLMDETTNLIGKIFVQDFLAPCNIENKKINIEFVFKGIDNV